jgi:glycosyltransferase involved in cell wall biosynthesis
LSSGTETTSARLDLSVVIPTFNEEENIVPLYEELTEVLQGQSETYEILFVDDGSTDQTFLRIHGLHEKDNHVRAVRLRKNVGQSAAMLAGFDHARGHIVVTMDADQQNDPHDIPKVLDELAKGYDVICGWRWNRKDTLPKKATSKVANRLRNLLTDEPVHDSGCTLKAFRCESLEDLELYGEMHRYIPAMLSWKGYRIGEVKTNHRPRVRGKTKYNWKRLSKGFLDLLLVTFWQKYSARPIHVFGGLGLILATAGIILGAYLSWERLAYNHPLANRPMLLLAILMVLVGVQFVVSGVMADIMLKIYYGQNDRKHYLVERIIE